MPSAATVASLTDAVSTCSARIESAPYNPAHWTERADCFLTLNYPELAVGDAYRATLLFERADAVADTRHEGGSADSMPKHKSGADEAVRVKAYTILGQALYDCHCHVECYEFWLELTQRTEVPGVARLALEKASALRQLLVQKEEAAAAYGGSGQQQRDRLRDGSVVTVLYPWMEQRHLARSSELIAHVNEELGSNVQPRACRVGKSTLAAVPDMLGVFAVRAIRKGECILIDRTTTAACSAPPTTPHCENCYDAPLSAPIHARCCSALYCSPTCHDLAKTYHPPLCGQDFSWLLAPAAHLRENASPMRPLLMLRFLAHCVQAGVDTHPLSHPLIARLQPLANAGHLDVFTLGESVVAPLRILRQLGVDVFRARHLDTMALHALWTRLANNKAGSFDAELGFVDEVTPLLPLFNHSCAPNVEYKKESGTSTVRFFALRDVEAGEELFDSYLDVEGLPRAERVDRMWPWFEQACLCPRCRKEADSDGR